LDLISIGIFVEKDLNISNSNILFNKSSIVSKGCINLSNATLTVDLNGANLSKILLFNSIAGCLYGDDSNSIKYLNQPECTNLEKEQNSFTLSVILVKSSCDDNIKGNESPIESWIVILIIVIIILSLAIIFVVIVFSVPNLRRKIFPYGTQGSRVKNVNRQTHSIKDLQDRVKSLDNEISEVRESKNRVEDLLKDTKEENS